MSYSSEDLLAQVESGSQILSICIHTQALSILHPTGEGLGTRLSGHVYI